MSSLQVRDLARYWINQSVTVPYHDTINRMQKPADMVWVTAEFFTTSSEGLMGCSGYTEYGTIDLIFMSTPGIGDTLILKEIENSIPPFMLSVDPNAKVSLLTYEPPRELSGGDADLWYRIGVGVDYAYSY